MDDFLSFVFLNNTVEEWLIAIVILLCVALIIYLFKIIVLNRLEILAKKTKFELDDVLICSINQIGVFFYFIIGLWIASQWILLPTIASRVIDGLTLAVLLFYTTITIQKLFEYIIKKYFAKREEKEKDIGATLIVQKFLKQVMQVILWTVALLLFLQNLGVQISVLLGGLGVAGLAIGFAVQNILEDVFSFFSIYFDKPFEIGDLIIVGEEVGTVETIGIKSTRIRSLQGQELVISNKELISRQIHNYRKMQERRIIFKFGITYETSYENVKKVEGIVRKIFDKIESARLDRIHFHEFGDFSLNYEVVYYVTTQDYYTYMDTQQAVNLALFSEFEKQGISFAYPTSRILLDKK